MFSPIVNNHLFPAARMDHTFTQWQRVGLLRCSDFYIDGLFGSFNDLKKKFNLQRSDLFRYFQVRHFIQTWSSSFPALPVNSELDTLLQTPVQNKGQISVITNTIFSFQKVSLDKIRTDPQLQSWGWRYLTQPGSVRRVESMEHPPVPALTSYSLKSFTGFITPNQNCPKSIQTLMTTVIAVILLQRIWHICFGLVQN